MRAGRLVMFAMCVAVAGCGDGGTAPPQQRSDPVVEQVVDGPLTTDPDLSAMDESGEAVTVDIGGEMPALPADPDAIAAARAEAIRIAGSMDAALPPRSATFRDVEAGPTAHTRALGISQACAARLSTSAIWAARLPALMPVYPRGAVAAAAGSDASGCRVRAIAFDTPVAPEDVLAFYVALARRAKIAPALGNDGQGAVLRGVGGGLAFDLRLAGEGAGTRARLAVVLR